MRLRDERGSIAGRMVLFGLIGLAIGGALGLLVGGLVFGFGSVWASIFIWTGVGVGLLVGVAMGWFRGIGDSAPREGPYDEI